MLRPPDALDLSPAARGHRGTNDILDVVGGRSPGGAGPVVVPRGPGRPGGPRGARRRQLPNPAPRPPEGALGRRESGVRGAGPNPVAGPIDQTGSWWWPGAPWTAVGRIDGYRTSDRPRPSFQGPVAAQRKPPPPEGGRRGFRSRATVAEPRHRR
jgi:hypothetical protein